MLLRFEANVILLLLCFVPVCAQQPTADRAAALRVQLADVLSRETDLQTRLAQVDEAIKPENIERSLAGLGSTHPEELREARRRQLEMQRNGLQSQLESISATRARLEAAIAAAEVESYPQAATPSGSSVTNSHGKVVKRSHRQRRRQRRKPKK